MIVMCPKCPNQMRIEQEVPALPHGLGLFDCPMCLHAFVVWRHPDEGIKTSAVTRTGAAPRATS